MLKVVYEDFYSNFYVFVLSVLFGMSVEIYGI